jgi:hypothetical protein
MPSSAAGARTVSQPMPAARSGRDAIPGPAPDDRPVPAAVAPGRRRAERRDPGRPAPRARATRTWAWYGWPSPALSPPWPGRAAAPAPAGCAGPAAIVRGWPVRAGASQASSHVWVCRYRCGPVRRRVPLVTRGPGSDGLAPGHPRGCRHDLAEWLAGRPVWPPRAAVSPHRPSEPCPDFSNHTILAGASLRNRTVDLLLTMHTGFVWWRRVESDYRRSERRWRLATSRRVRRCL